VLVREEAASKEGHGGIKAREKYFAFPGFFSLIGGKVYEER